MDFVKVVKGLLLTEGTMHPDAKTYLLSNKSRIKSAYGVFAAPTSTVGVDIFPDGEFAQIAHICIQNSPRFTKDYTQIPKFLSSFPLLDLFGNVIDIFKDTTKPTADRNNDSDAELSRWETVMRKSDKIYPIDFPATNPWALTVKQNYEQKLGGFNEGETKYDAYGAVSIEDGVFKLMGQRASAALRKLPPEHFQQSAEGQGINNFLQQILENPKKYNSGAIPYPDKKMGAIYGQETPPLILEIATVAYKLFEQQFAEKIAKHAETNGATGYILKPAARYDSTSKKFDETTKLEMYKMLIKNTLKWDNYREKVATPP